MSGNEALDVFSTGVSLPTGRTTHIAIETVRVYCTPALCCRGEILSGQLRRCEVPNAAEVNISTREGRIHE